MTQSYKVFEVEKKDHVAWVFMNRPDKLNACGPDFWREIIDVMRQMDTDDDVRAVILAGRGKAFTTGIDLVGMVSEVPALTDPNVQTAPDAPGHRHP
jgi:enoyl-CoA hydratase